MTTVLPQSKDKLGLIAPGEEPHQTDGLTIYFDGSCPLCSAEIGYYRSLKGGEALRLVDVSLEDARIGQDLTRELAMKRFHIRRPDGKLLSGANAFIGVWEVLPGWRQIAKIAVIPGASKLLELLYRLFLPVRPAVSAIFKKLSG